MTDSNEFWHEIYQSSPTPLVQLSDNEFQEFAERSGLPGEYAEQVRAKPVKGTLRFRFPLRGLGTMIRLRLSNEERDTPLVIAAGFAALDDRPDLQTAITFGGRAEIAIAPGAPAISDPIALPAGCHGQLMLSFHLPEGVLVGGFGKIPVDVAAGNQSCAEKLNGAQTFIVRPFISGISTARPGRGPVMAAFGDSLTDANCNFPASWPDILQSQLNEASPGQPGTISNAGIGGNRLLANGLQPDMGVAGLARFERDVLRIENLSHVVVLIGTNDIGLSGIPELGQALPLRAEDLVAGYQQLIARTRLRGAKVILGTITPFEDSEHYSPEKEDCRQAVNSWIRSSNGADGFVDFDAAVRDPDRPSRLLPAYDLGDHLHFNAEGCQALAMAFDVTMLSGSSSYASTSEAVPA